MFIETVRNPPRALAETLYTPVRTPELLISQCEPSDQSKVTKVVTIWWGQPVVVFNELVMKPVPEIVPVSPRLPLDGVSVNMDWTTNCSV